MIALAQCYNERVKTAMVRTEYGNVDGIRKGACTVYMGMRHIWADFARNGTPGWECYSIQKCTKYIS
jgi:hypothetical protein